MKSFVANPQEFHPPVSPQKNTKNTSEKLVAYCELHKKVSHLDGFIAMCGIAVAEDLTSFAAFAQSEGSNAQQKIIAFEKHPTAFSEELIDSEEIIFNVKERELSSFNNIYSTTIQQGVSKCVEFVPGLISEVLPDLIMQNPELKLSMLTIDLDEYDSTITTLEFLYPRLVPGGILILNNFHKSSTEACAVKDYFSRSKVLLNKFSANNGPHFIFKS